jgi:hypothetical protein
MTAFLSPLPPILRSALLLALCLLCLADVTVIAQVVAPSCLIGFTADDGQSGGFQNVVGSFRVDLNSFNATDHSYLVIPSSVSASGAGPATYLGLGPGLYFTNDNKLYNVTASASGVTVQSGVHVDTNGLGLKRTSNNNQSILIFYNGPNLFGSPVGVVVKDQEFLFSGPAAATFNLTGCSVGSGSSSSTGPASAFSDPRFVGFWGQSFYVSGYASGVYTLISDADVLLNAYFVQLERIRCPLGDDGKPLDRCFDHPGTYFGVLAIVTAQGEHLRITAGEVDHGFKSVTLNDQPFTASSSSASSSSLFVRRLSARALEVQAGQYTLLIENVDLYMDLAKVNVSCWDCLVDTVRPEGLLGRTWDATLGAPATEEEVEQYREQDSNILGCNTGKDRFCSSRHAPRSA